MRGSMIGMLLLTPNLWAAEGTEPPTPREQYEALLKQYDAPLGTYQNDKPKSKAATGPFLELARKHPNNPAAFDALHWVVTHTLFTPMADQALNLLARDHVGDRRLKSTIQDLDRLSGEWTESREQLLRAALGKGADRNVRGWAGLSLGRALAIRKERVEQRRYMHMLFTKGIIEAPYTGQPEETDADLKRMAEEAEALFERVIREYGDLDGLGDRARAELFEVRNIAVGDPAPEIEGVDVAGKQFKLSDFLGKVVVLTFSGDWCGPCRAMYPAERDLVKRLKDEPFALLSVNTDPAQETLRRLIRSEEITWRCWWDGGPEGPISSKWNIAGFPTVYVIDAKGVIRFKDPEGPALDAAVKTLLGEAKAKPRP